LHPEQDADLFTGFYQFLEVDAVDLVLAIDYFIDYIAVKKKFEISIFLEYLEAVPEFCPDQFGIA
jgi:hypothetical protein